MAAEMVGIMGSALAQEGLSGVSSYISTKLEEKASREHIMARLQMALSRLEFALEMTRKMPITCVSLLRRRKDFERAYNGGTRLLNKHKLQVMLMDEFEEKLKDKQDMGQVVTQSSFPFLERIFGRATNFTAFLPKKRKLSSLLGLSKEEYLSSSVVRKYEWYADCADNFLRDVEFGCPLRQGTSRYPFVRHLLEGKTLKYVAEMKGNQLLRFYIWPVIVEGRGVEVELYYQYVDCKMLEKSFCLYLSLRISEDTDIVGVATKCMQFFKSHFNLAAESALGEFSLLPNLQDILCSYDIPSWFNQEEYVSSTKWCRPDPTCCNGNSCGTQADKSSIDLPEPVLNFYFNCHLSAQEYMGTDAPLLYLRSLFVPHPSHGRREIKLKYGGKVEIKNGSMQQLGEMAKTNAFDYLVHEPEPTGYALFWNSEHGGAFIILGKPSHETESCPVPMAVPRPGRRASKRKR